MSLTTGIYLFQVTETNSGISKSLSEASAPLLCRCTVACSAADIGCSLVGGGTTKKSSSYLCPVQLSRGQQDTFQLLVWLLPDRPDVVNWVSEVGLTATQAMPL